VQNTPGAGARHCHCMAAAPVIMTSFTITKNHWPIKGEYYYPKKNITSIWMEIRRTDFPSAHVQ
jgi:hypothetical protein